MSRVKLEGLYLKNFRSIQYIDWDLSAVEPGLIFVSGQNNVEPSLGANGAGKSSLFEGLVWTLYGQNSRNIKTPTLVTWGESKRSICGRVRLSIDDEPIQIERTAQTAGLRIFQHDEWRTSTQADVNRLLGLDFNSFIWLVYIPQFGIRFFDLTPTEKLSLFTSIMEESLNKWVVYADKAKDRAAELTRLLQDAAQEQSRVIGFLQAQSTTEYEKLSRDFELQRNQNIIEVRKKLVLASKQKRLLNEQLAETKIEKRSCVKQIEVLEIDKARLQEQVERLDNLKQLAVEAFITSRSEVRNLELRLTQIDELGFRCPTCMQETDEASKRQARILLKAELKVKRRTLKEDEVIKETARDELQKMKGMRGEVIDKIEDMRHTLSTVEHSESTLVTNKGRCVDELQTLKGDIEALKSQPNEYNTLIRKTENKRKLLNRVATSMLDEITEMDLELVAQNYWKKGFKDIRIMLIQQALKEFESYVNMNLVSLGLDNWKVMLDVESETKSGSIRRELSVFVTTTEEGEKMTVPFNVWSGGEGQRLRLAGILGLIDFIQNYNNIEFDMEIYDEPTTWLSNAGITNLIETLAQRAAALDRRVLVIDHRDLESMGTFDHIITVCKDATGTHIEENVA